MPKLDTHPAKDRLLTLVVGDNAAGKTGGLASLAKAGYQLRILDFDNNLAVLRNYLTPKEQQNVEYVTLTDKMKALPSGMLVPDGVPTAMRDGMALLTKWKYWIAKDGTVVVKEKDKKSGATYEEVDYGRPVDWGSEVVLVLDSLTTQGKAALRRVRDRAGRNTERVQLQDWGEAIEQQEGVLALLNEDQFKCNILVNSHIKYVEIDNEDEEVVRAHPSALGRALPPHVGTYFNAIIELSGNGKQRKYKTRGRAIIPLRSPFPEKVPDALPIETGLADLFKACFKEWKA